MTKSIFISLPVTDVARSAAFYEALGFERDARFSGEKAAAMKWSDAITFMLIDKAFFGTLTPKALADPREVAHALVALAMDSRVAVDAIVEKARAAGGTIDASPPEELGFMYSRDFADPDGHGFGPFFMEAQAETQAA